MRHIKKGESPEEFKSFLKRDRPSEWDAIRQAIPPVYDIVCDSLDVEQEHLCGYTELPLKGKGHRHIDHYYTRYHYPRQECCFSWDNLILAAKDEEFGAKFKDKQINHVIKSTSVYNEIFNPVVDDPQSYFVYDSFGEIRPKDNIQEDIKQKAIRTIEIFNLNERSLKNKRQGTVIAVNSYLEGGLSKEEVVNFLIPGGFVSLIDQFLG